MVRLIISLILLGLLTACTTSVLAPTNRLVEKAIAFELEQTQQQLSQQLDLIFRDLKSIGYQFLRNNL
jgi:Na+-translocating ferredoxin:NAD+ oxidoreductase RnfG subunit